MSCRVIRLAEEPQFVGRAVCAIGVFDGVHLGHAALAHKAVELAEKRGVEAFAVTFDRDPDQVLTPETAAPQLLSLDAKSELLCDVGIDAVLVVPFTLKVAALSPRDFLSEILLSAVDPIAIVVGQDFRFGRYAKGTVATLTEYCEPRHIEVAPQQLVSSAGYPVTSTRIRGLVAAGDVEAAQRLLGRPHRVEGTVVRGRGEGAAIGVPTANVAPLEYAALPAAGVYAGRATVGAQSWPSAISVGRPPTFPEATDVLEAHLIGFQGDLYGCPITVEFLTRLREQRPFGSIQELGDALRGDIEAAARIAGPPVFTSQIAETVSDDEYTEYLADGSPVIENPGVLEAAERAVARATHDSYAGFSDDWVQVLGPVSLVPITAGVTAFQITSPLAAAGIPFVWDPYDPQDMTSRAELITVKKFRLLVPPAAAQTARSVLDPIWNEPAS